MSRDKCPHCGDQRNPIDARYFLCGTTGRDIGAVCELKVELRNERAAHAATRKELDECKASNKKWQSLASGQIKTTKAELSELETLRSRVLELEGLATGNEEARDGGIWVEVFVPNERMGTDDLGDSVGTLGDYFPPLGEAMPRKEGGVKERPILFSGPTVRAILEGRTTQTRRVVMPQFNVLHQIRKDCAILTNRIFRRGDGWIKSPYGQPGDRLWVRETWGPCAGGVVYRDDFPACPDGGKWKPSIFMPRWASRITLEIVSVRVERVQGITVDDAEKEGCGFGVNDETGGPVARFKNLWDSINSSRGFGWYANPWVWVIEFQRL